MASTLVGRSGLSGSVLFVVARAPGLGFGAGFLRLADFFRVMVLRVMGLHLQIGFCGLFCCAGVADFAGLCRNLPKEVVYFL